PAAGAGAGDAVPALAWEELGQGSTPAAPGWFAGRGFSAGRAAPGWVKPSGLTVSVISGSPVGGASPAAAGAGCSAVSAAAGEGTTTGAKSAMATIATSAPHQRRAPPPAPDADLAPTDLDRCSCSQRSCRMGLLVPASSLGYRCPEGP